MTLSVFCLDSHYNKLKEDPCHRRHGLLAQSSLKPGQTTLLWSNEEAQAKGLLKEYNILTNSVNTQ